MLHHLAIQNTYDIFEMALFQDNTLIDYLSEDKRHTSKLFIPMLDQLCTKNNIAFANLDFCAVNAGPGPFSTLRSVIASVNGLHMATSVPLISIDGLNATFTEFYDDHYEYTVILLNAFNNEVYYLIAHKNQIISKGYKNIHLLLQEIVQEYENQSIHFLGNGVILYDNLIKEIYTDNELIKINVMSMCSIKTIGDLGLRMFLNKEVISSEYLMPLHLKKFTF